MNAFRLSFLAFGLALSAAGSATIYIETEANDSFAAADAFPFVVGDKVQGTSTGSAVFTPGLLSADYYSLGIAAAVPGIYRNVITLTGGTTNHTPSLRGLDQNNGVIGPGDAPLQTPATGASRATVFYSFGTAANLDYRVAGSAATTGVYTATYTSRTAVLPVDLGTLQAGSLTFSTVGQTPADTEFIVLDANYAQIPNFSNDDEPSETSLQSSLTRTFAPGVYYVALSNYNTFGSLPLATDDGSIIGPVLRTAGFLGNSSTEGNLDLSFTLTSAAGAQRITARKANAFDINFFKVTVRPVPEPASVAALGLGLAAFRKRRAKW